MPKYALVLKYLYPAHDRNDYKIAIRDGVESIAHWNENVLGPRPTDEFLATKEAEAVAHFQSIESDNEELKRLKSLKRSDWTAADVRSAVQIWVSRQ